MADATLSGATRLSSTSNIITRSFELTVSSVSNVFATQFILAAGTSEFVVSIATLSAPTYVVAQATGLCRINYGNHASYVSAASAGWPFTFWAQLCSGGSGPLALHFGNSGSDSATITVHLAQ